MDKIKTCLNCVHCKYRADRGVYCKQGQWLTDAGHEFAYNTIDSAGRASRRLVAALKAGEPALKSFVGKAGRCELYEE